MTKTALIVDDEPDIRELLEITLGRMDIETESAPDVTMATSLLSQHAFDLCLTDMNLPDGNGIDLVRHINENYSELPVAVITAYGSMDTAIDALKAGAFDFLPKPVDLEQLRTLVDTALRLKPLDGPRDAEPEDEPDDGRVRMSGNSKAMGRLRTQISKLARSQAPIYISGESGSGKEVAARSIHEQGPRGDKPFVPVNCGAIPGELMESEFFGHKKGSFTGAVADKQGLFQAAHGGTLFLDEVADLPLNMQVKLLRAIQEKAIRPIGEQKEVNIDVRIISATHKDLAAEVEGARFRQDLFYRINVIELNVPSLRERPDDIPQLAERALDRLANEYGTPRPTISGGAMEALIQYPFPGNVRELENILERAYTLCEDDTIQAGDLQLTTVTAPIPAAPPHPSTTQRDAEDDADALSGNAIDGNDDSADAQTLTTLTEDFEKKLIVDALEATRWNKTAAAKRLGITFRALRYKLKKLGME